MLLSALAPAQLMLGAIYFMPIMLCHLPVVENKMAAQVSVKDNVGNVSVLIFYSGGLLAGE